MLDLFKLATRLAEDRQGIIAHLMKVFADRAITEKAQDRLGRLPLAHRLAVLSMTAPADHGQVIGLEARWGEGKTSVLNLLERELQSAEFRDRAVLFRFDPWYWSGTSELLREFFRQLGARLKIADPRLEEVAKLLTRYGALLATLSPLGPPGAVAGATGIALVIAGKAITFGAAKPGPELDELRKHIETELLKVRRRVVVVIDDIDRLYDHEIREVVHMIKLTADFPDFVYVVAYDRRRVSAALATQGADGLEYMQKIVQIPIPLPSPHQAQLRSAVMTPLADVLQTLPDRFFAGARWQRLQNDALFDLITTLRSAIRVANALSVGATELGPELNGVDLVGLTLLGVIVPDVYDHIRRNAHAYLDTSGSADDVTKTLSAVAPEIRTAVTAVIAALFPNVEARLASRTVAPDPMWEADQRVCAPSMFPRYFALTLPAEQIGGHVLDELLASLNEPDKFQHLLRQSLASPAHGDVIYRLSRTGDGDEDLRRRLVDALLPLWDEFSMTRESLSLDDQSIVGVMAYQTVRDAGATSEAKRTRALKLASESPLGAAVYVGLSVDGEQGERILPNAESLEVTRLVADRLVKADAREIQRVGTVRAMAAMVKWLSADDLRTRVKELGLDDEIFKDLVRGLRRQPPLGGPAVVDWDLARRLFDNDFLIDRANAAFGETTSEADTELLQLIKRGPTVNTAPDSPLTDWSALLGTWAQASLQSRHRPLKAIQAYLTEHMDDDEFLRENMPSVPEELVADLTRVYPTEFLTVVMRYADYVSRLKVPFNFRYLDDVATFFKVLYRATTDLRFKRLSLRRLLETGSQFDETDIANALIEMLAEATREEAELVLEARDENPDQIAWLRDRSKNRHLDSSIRSIIRSV